MSDIKSGFPFLWECMFRDLFRCIVVMYVSVSFFPILIWRLEVGYVHGRVPPQEVDFKIYNDSWHAPMPAGMDKQDRSCVHL